ncbi:hypothetical protein [Caulobacter endophyticus]|uniref:Uncharacterized protein n=1 Tax=Caulobacter endophyticus TaxID=2172652 RepID=A0A2T9JY16_9CAUL|nr:hypothetical protein [Caulobacter endophyticus]PVM88605.1 hypothetical protein DDF67_13145 [Caulobacter endophyticus]
MTEKTVRPAFQPAPRPRPINDAGSAEALRKATEDLGFARTTSAPPSAAAPAPAEAPSEAKSTPVAVAPPPPAPKLASVAPVARPASKAKPVKPAPAADFSDRETSLKFAIDDELSTALKLDAVRRRVTVKYLVLEALAEKGYPVDLANLPEDGRRIRK